MYVVVKITYSNICFVSDHPTKDDRSVDIRTVKMSLNITMNFYKVYPMPICFVKKVNHI